MPQKWQQVDTDFPTFTGNESVTEKVDQIINYLRILVEELQYQLQNLDESNWNANAWNNLEANTEAAVAEKVQALENSITALKIEINALSGRVSQSESRITEAETAISELEQQADEQAGLTEQLTEQLSDAQADIDDLQQRLDAEGGIVERLCATEKAAAIIGQDADGNPVIGSEDAVLKLVGRIYINGILFEGGVDDETAES